MILLQPDCLVFKTAGGENIPCSAQQVTVELMGPSVSGLEEEVVKNAAQAVLHYFKVEVGKTLVSVGEFAQVLERVLRGLGFSVQGTEAKESPGVAASSEERTVAECDLTFLAASCGQSYELVFFSHLRQELRRQLDCSPGMIRFRGLRRCVKQLTGAIRWTSRCQRLQDQIVGYLRACLFSEMECCACDSCPLLID